MSNRPPFRRRLARAVTTACEALENRRLLAVDLQWTNRGAGDDFATWYGANAGVARNAVDRAMEDWEKVIQNFNRSIFSNNIYSLSISAGPISGRGVTNITGTDIFTGKPTSSTITMDDNGGGATNGWYFDSFIGTDGIEDDGEFTNPITPFTAGGGPAGTADFYRTAVHEIGHAMGIFNGGVLGGLSTDVGDDPNSSDPADRLIAINTNGVAGAEFTLTSNGGGHLFEGGGSYAGPTHPNNLMNSGRTYVAGRRQLIGNDEAILLRDGLGYDVTLPSTFHSFYVGLNRTTNTVTVYGDINESGSDVDVIDIELEANGDLRVESQGGAFIEIIPNAEYTTLIINSGNADDDIDIDFLAAGKTVIVNAGSGNDAIDLALESDDLDTDLQSDLSINGGAGTDTIDFNDTADGVNSDNYTISSTQVIKSPTGSNRIIGYSLTERLNIFGSAQNNTWDLNSLSSGVTLDMNGGAGNDTLELGNDMDSIAGSVFFAGGAGSDVANLRDTADLGGARTYTWSGQNLDRPGSGSYTIEAGTEDVNVFGSGAANTYVVPQVSPSYTNLSFTGGGAADTFNVGNFGDVTTNLTSDLSMIGGAGLDVFNWTDNGVGGDYTLTSGSIRKGVSTNPQTSYSGIETVNISASNDADTITVSSTSSVAQTTLLGRSGNDAVTLNDGIIGFVSINGPILVSGGLGDDSVTYNDNLTGSTLYTLGTSSFQRSGSALVNHSSILNLTVNGGTGNNTFDVDDINIAETTLNGGDGNDTFNVGNGDFDNIITGSEILLVNGEVGTDRLIIDDTLDTFSDVHAVGAFSYSKDSTTGLLRYGPSGLVLGPTPYVEQLILSTSNAGVTVNVTALGGRTFAIPPATPTDVPTNASIIGGSGNDTINVSSGSLTSLVGNLFVNPQVGSDVVNVKDANDTDNDSFAVASGTVTNSDWDYTLTTNIAATELRVLDAGSGNNVIDYTGAGGTILNGNGGADTFDVNSGVVTVHGGAGLDNVLANDDAVGTAEVVLDTNEDLDLLHTYVGGLITMVPNGNLWVDAQSMGTQRGIFNLNDNFAVARTSPESFLVDKLARGFNGGAWNGVPVAPPGGVIRSDVAAATPKSDGVGYARIGGAVDELNIAVYRGVNLAAGNIILSYTLSGDADLDKDVDFDDLLRLAQSYGVPGKWVNGNSNYDANVNFDDLLVVAQNYNTTALASQNTSATASQFSTKRGILDSRESGRIV